MSDLVAFLTARLDEDEQWANEALAERHDWVRNMILRVLREVEGKRKILTEYAAVRKLIELMESDKSPLMYREWTLRALASVYSNHPDYDPAWGAGSG